MNLYGNSLAISNHIPIFAMFLFHSKKLEDMLSVNYDAIHAQLTNKQIMPLGEHFSITDADNFTHCLKRCNEIIQSLGYHCIINATINNEPHTKKPIILQVDTQVGWEITTTTHTLTIRSTRWLCWQTDLSKLFMDIVCGFIQITKK